MLNRSFLSLFFLRLLNSSILLFSLLFIVHNTLLPAIVAGTLIKTQHGLIPIEELNVGDKVLAFAPDKSHIEVRIGNIVLVEPEKTIIIETDRGNICTSENQLFYDPKLDSWIKAKNLTRQHNLLDANQNNGTCLAIKSANTTINMYEIFLEPPHTFFLSDSQVLTHNEPISISIGIALLFGEGAIVVETISIGIGIVGAFAYKHFYRDKALDQFTKFDKNESNFLLENGANLTATESFAKSDKEAIAVDYVAKNAAYKEAKKQKKADKQEHKNSKDGNNPNDPGKGKKAQIPVVPKSKSNEAVKDAQAPGKPTEKDGYFPPKRWNGEKVKHPQTGKYGYPDKDGNVWVPTGHGSGAHGGPHWDVQNAKGRSYKNILPGGKER